MAESIEYSSIVKFINEDIIQGKLSVQAGGMNFGAPASKGDVIYTGLANAAVTTEALIIQLEEIEGIKEYLVNNKLMINLVSESLKSTILEQTKTTKKMISIEILCFGLAVAGFYWMNFEDSDEKMQNILYILGATIVAFMLSGPGEELVNYIKNYFFGVSSQPISPEQAARELKQAKESNPEIVTNKSKVNQELLSKTKIVVDGGSLNAAANAVVDFVKKNFKLIVAAVGGTAAIAAFFLVDPNLSLSENVSKLLGRRSSKNASYYFNASNGRIEVTGSTNKTVTLNSSKHFGINGIVMKVAGDKITYTVNGTELDSISYIEGKPVHTALVMAYMVKERSYHMPSSVSGKSDSDFVYAIEDDGSVRLFKKKPDGSQGEEVASINMAIRHQMSGDEAGAKKAREEVCKKLFVSQNSSTVCSAHFYNILGKSALGMLNNLSKPATKEDVQEALIKADPHVQYEILKNLDWKMKVSNGNKEMVTVDQWLERLDQDTRAEMKSLVAEYKKYFNTNGHVKSILDRMVANLNNNSRLLDEKYKEAVSTPQPAIRRRRARLSAAQVSNLRSQVLTDNVSLNSPFPVPGRPGVFLTNYSSPFGMNGGADNSLQAKFSSMKQALASFNQKLSSDTERKINSKIEEINELDSRLADIHRKINEYTRILRTEKYPTNFSRTVSLSDIENLISQYKSGTQEQTKQIVTLSTAFGKIKMLLEKADVSGKPSSKNYLFDL